MKTLTRSLPVLFAAACGENGPYELVVETDVVFCAPALYGNSDFASARAQRFRAVIPADEYVLPATAAPSTKADDGIPHSRPHRWRLPVILEFENETIVDAVTDDGELFVEMNEGLSETKDRAFFFAKQPVVGAGGREGSFNLEQVEEATGSRSFVVDANYDPVTLGVALWWDTPPYSFLASCDFDHLIEGRRYTWRVVYEGGTIDLEWADGWWRWPASPPVVFTRARGEHDGVRHEQTDFFKLIHFATGLHLQWNNFAVLFESPIGEACGIAFTNLGPADPEVPPPTAALVDCDLQDVQALEIVEATLILPD